ncbi:MAG: hypothetical protein PQJ35_06655 [Sphaerochaetaceae bacterium]|nr:hypothetical protein [Sphaerochaetaceae bacterium]
MDHNLTLRIVLILLSIAAILLPLTGASLIYDPNGASITDFYILTSDSNNPAGLANSTDYTYLDGYSGRVYYTGEPTTLSFFNGGPQAQNTQNNRFYFTRTTSTNSWREIFFVTRVKGSYHNGTVVNHDPVNTVIEHPGDTVTLPGAGPQQLSEPGQGYNAQGVSGYYDGSNQYKYQYRYSYTILEITIIRTSYTRNFSNWFAYYESGIILYAPGAETQLSFVGKVYFSWGQGPDQYTFSVNRTVGDIIPLETLTSKTSLSNSLLVGTLTYQSFFQDQGTVGFYADSAGTSTSFNFESSIGSNTYSFPYNVVFDPQTPGGSAVRISSSNNGFTSASSTVSSPMGGSSTSAQVLEGDIRIYLDSAAVVFGKPPGEYSSIIYCLLTIN